MVAGSILPISFNEKNELCFLFGKENPMEDSAKGFSDFGGRLENKEKPFEGALREGSEELTGFLGNSKQLRTLIKKNGGYYKIKVNTYHIHIFYMPYDSDLPIYYNNNHAFLWDKMDKEILNETRLFEKIEINWFTEKQMQSRKGEFRNFYQEMVDVMLNDEKIKNFAQKCKTNHGKNKTLRKIKN